MESEKNFTTEFTEKRKNTESTEKNFYLFFKKNNKRGERCLNCLKL